MQRGRGNPNRGAPTKEMYAQAIGVKFKAWRTLFSQEQFLATVAQIPAVKEELLDTWLEDKVNTTGRETFEAGWYQYYKIKRDVKAKEAAIDQDFYKSFLMWLIGKGKPSDHDVTPWGREAHALQIPEVRALMDAFLDEISLVENAIAKLLFRGPQTLNEYFIYYKYILQHEKYMLSGDPWFFLEFKRYAGKLDNQGRASRMGESGQPIPDTQDWIKVRDVFAETGERNAELLANIRDNLAAYQSDTQIVLGELREGMEAVRKGNLYLQKQEKDAWNYSGSDSESDVTTSTLETTIVKLDAVVDKLDAKLDKEMELLQLLYGKNQPEPPAKMEEPPVEPPPAPEPAAKPVPEAGLPPELNLAAIVRRQAQKHIVAEPQLLPPELDLAQLDNPPTLEGRSITPPPVPATGDHPPNSSETVNKIRQGLSPQEQQQTESTREAVAIQARRRFGLAYPSDKYPEHEQFVQDAERLAAMAQSVNISPERLREPTSLAIDDVIEGIMKGDRGRANQGLEKLRQYVIQARKTTQK